MERDDVISKLTEIFRKVFNSDSLVLSDELTANDVDHWDSLTHMILITDIEDSFSIKFRLKELNRMRNVGEMIDIIISKIQITTPS
jgi:acyl carrier protein